MAMLRLLFWSVLLTPLALCQTVPPNDVGVSMGHLHFTVRDIAAQKGFWVEGLGAVPVKLASIEGVKVPGAIVLFKQGESSGGTEPSTINHVGVKVRNLKEAVAKCEAAGAKTATQNAKQAMMIAPDEIRVELTEDAAMTTGVAHHHIHFYNTSATDTQAWYAKMFHAKPGKRGPFEAADLPGANLTFSVTEHATAPTKGRALDHIGFEVKDLAALCHKLEGMGVKFDVPYRKVPALGIAVAFLTDPWGTYIELTEGLDRL